MNLISIKTLSIPFVALVILSITMPSFSKLLEDLDEIKKLKSQTNVFLPRLSSLLTDFLKVGGFPSAVEQFLRAGSLSEDILEIYLTVIRSDFEKIKKAESFSGKSPRGPCHTITARS